MKNRITKQVKAELKNILDQFGYWSEETKNYISEFDFISAKKLHSIAQTYSKYGYGL